MHVIDIIGETRDVFGENMRIKDAVFVYRLIGGNRLALHGRHHAHEGDYEIHFFLEGSGTFLLGRSKYAIEGNRLFLTGPGEPHSILPGEIKSPVSYYAVLFRPELPADSGVLPLLDGGARSLAAKPHERFLLEELCRLQGRNHGLAAGHLLLSLLYLWQGEAPGRGAEAGEAGPAKNAHVERALALMEKSVKEKLGTEAMAEKLGVSKEHFIRVFRDGTGISPLRYFTKLKVEAAGSFLADGRLKIGAVAEYFGFESPFHFSRVFKKFTGLSPKEYRRTFRRV